MSSLAFQSVYEQAIPVQNQSKPLKTALTILWENGTKVLHKLYAEQTNQVIQMCYDVSPRFCLHVVTNIYGLQWFLSVPNDYQKALITNIALILDNSYHQLAVLVETFLRAAEQQFLEGADILVAAINYLQQQQWINQTQASHAKQILCDKNNIDTINPISLTKQDIDIIHLAVMATLRKQPSDVPLTNTIDKQQQQQLIFHLNTYIGCPRVWDASNNLDS